MHYTPSGGWIELVCGSMFSGKTEELLRRVRRAEIARKKVQLFKPTIDNRYGIVRVASHDGNMLRYLGSLNLKPGVPLQLVSRAPFGGPLRLRVTNSSFHDEHVIGAELAEKIYVTLA